MKWKTWIPLVLAIVLGVVAAKVGRDMILRSRFSAPAATKLAPMVLAKADLTPGQEIRQEDLAVGRIGAEQTPPGMFRDTADLVGRVVAVQVGKGQPVLEGLLAPKGSGAGLQALVPDGMRAIAIEVNEFGGVAGLLFPGCHVDVVSTFADEQTHQPMARIIVQNVNVTAVGQRMTPTPGNSEQQPWRSVTLIVSPEQAEAIELAASTGRPRLVLRSTKDDEEIDAMGIGLAQLTGRPPQEPNDPFAQPLPAAHQPATQPVEPARPIAPVARVSVPATQPATEQHRIQVIRGGAQSEVVFEIPRPVPQGLLTGSAIEQEPVLPAAPHR